MWSIWKLSLGHPWSKNRPKITTIVTTPPNSSSTRDSPTLQLVIYIVDPYTFFFIFFFSFFFHHFFSLFAQKFISGAKHFNARNLKLAVCTTAFQQPFRLLTCDSDQPTLKGPKETQKSPKARYGSTIGSANRLRVFFSKKTHYCNS